MKYLKDNLSLLSLLLIPLFLFLLVIGLKNESFALYIYYKPLYEILSAYFYKSYIIYLVKCILFLFVFCFSVYIFIVCFVKKQKNRRVWIFVLLFILIIPSVIIFITSKNLILDLLIIKEGTPLMGESNLSNIEKSHIKGRGGGHDVYRITVSGKDRSSNLDLDVFQYYELKREMDRYSEKCTDLEQAKIKVYYLPNTQILLKYEIIM